MGKGRDLALLAVLVAAVPFAAFAVRLPFDAGFGGECAEDGRPNNWEFHMYEGYLPKADVTAMDEPGVGKVLHYRNVRGKRGSSIYTVQRRPGRDGDIVGVSVMARGSGKAFVDLYCWGGDGKKFIRTLPEKHAALTPEWKTHEFQFTLEDHEVNGKTESFTVAIGIMPGADAYFHDVRVSRALEASESLDMDDFEKPAERAGSPEIISDNIAPGLLVETRQGVYRTQDVVEVSPAKAYAIPKDECSFLSAGVRIYGFGDDRSVSSGLLTKFACGTNRVVVAVRSSANMDDLACILFENGCRTASWPVPHKVLPADFTASVGADGTVNVAVTSLSDSSSRDCGGRMSARRIRRGGGFQIARVRRGTGRGHHRQSVCRRIGDEAHRRHRVSLYGGPEADVRPRGRRVAARLLRRVRRYRGGHQQVGVHRREVEARLCRVKR